MDDSLAVEWNCCWLQDHYEPELKKSSMKLTFEGDNKDCRLLQYMQFQIDTGDVFPNYRYLPRSKLKFVEFSPAYGDYYYISLVMSTLARLTCTVYCSGIDNFCKSLRDHTTIWRQRRWLKKHFAAGLIWFLKSRK